MSTILFNKLNLSLLFSLDKCGRFSIFFLHCFKNFVILKINLRI
jgi:hypothetical protein